MIRQRSLKAACCLILAVGLCASAAFAADQPVLTLEQAKRLALENSPSLQAGSDNVGAAREIVTEARAGYMPALTASLTAAGAKSYGSRQDNVAASTLQPRITAGALNTPTVLDRAAAGVTLTQLITDFGRTDNLVESAKASLSAAQNGLEDERQRLLLQVTTDYYRVLEAQATLRVANQTVQERSNLFDQISELQKNKLKSQLDTSFAGVELEQARLLVLQAHNAVDASQAQLLQTLGLARPQYASLQENTASVAAPPDSVEPLVQEALDERPALQGLRDRALAADRAARAQRALSYPVLSAIGAAGTTPYGDSRTSENYAAGGVNLSIPIFQGGRLDAQYHEAQFRAHQAEDELHGAEFAVTRDVRVAWLASTAGYQSLDVSEKLRTTADSALELAESRYHLGLSSIVELNTAQLNAVQAEIAAIRARYEYLVEQAALQYQLGKL